MEQITNNPNHDPRTKYDNLKTLAETYVAKRSLLEDQVKASQHTRWPVDKRTFDCAVVSSQRTLAKAVDARIEEEEEKRNRKMKWGRKEQPKQAPKRKRTRRIDDNVIATDDSELDRELDELEQQAQEAEDSEEQDTLQFRGTKMRRGCTQQCRNLRSKVPILPIILARLAAYSILLSKTGKTKSSGRRRSCGVTRIGEPLKSTLGTAPAAWEEGVHMMYLLL